MPVGYLVSVALVALGNLSFRLGLLLNEVPIVAFYWLLIWTSLALVQGDINSVGGWATVGLAASTTAGLAVVAWRGLQARPALSTPWPRPSASTGARPSTPGLLGGCAGAFRSPASCSGRCRAAAWVRSRQVRSDHDPRLEY